MMMLETYLRVTETEQNTLMRYLVWTCSSVSSVTEAGPGVMVGDATVEKARAAATAIACRMKAWIRSCDCDIQTIYYCK